MVLSLHQNRGMQDGGSVEERERTGETNNLPPLLEEILTHGSIHTGPWDTEVLDSSYRRNSSSRSHVLRNFDCRWQK